MANLHFIFVKFKRKKPSVYNNFLKYLRDTSVRSYEYRNKTTLFVYDQFPEVQIDDLKRLKYSFQYRQQVQLSLFPDASPESLGKHTV